MLSDLFVCGVRVSRELPENSYLNGIPAIRRLRESGGLRLTKRVTCLVGENGAGKSTLLEGIAVAMGFNPEGGTIHFQFSTKDTHSALSQYLTVLRGPYRNRDGFFLRAESFYNAATYLDSLPRGTEAYGGGSLHCRSHGESFLALVQHRFSANGLYLLDEPEAALSPTRQLALLCEIDRLAKQGAQFVIATHAPILMAYPDAQVLLLDENGIRPTAYTETEHFAVMKRFLNAPDKALRELLG